MTVSLFPPFPTFVDLDGSPLDAGFVYVGTANTDPTTSPISVYFDAALTIPASQPLRTSGGFIVDGSGTPQNVYAAGDFSVTIKNRLGVTLYTAPSYGFRIFADAITFDTLTVNTSIVPDAAGGATNGTNALAWSSSVSRAIRTRDIQLYSTTQPSVTGDLNKLTQLCVPLCMVEQTSSTATPAWVNGLNVNTAGSTRGGSAGLYEVAFSVALPAQYFPVATALDGASFGTEIFVSGRTTTRLLVRTSIAGVGTDMPFSVVVFGNPGISDPIT